MMIRLAEHAPWTGGYSSSDVRVAWAPGEVRDVSDELAAYLTTTFPGLFVPADSPVVPPPPPAPVPDPDPSLRPVQPTAHKARPKPKGR